MARNDTFIAAPPERVFEILSDPDNYGYWVVGSKRIRGADPEFLRPRAETIPTVGIAEPTGWPANAVPVAARQDAPTRSASAPTPPAGAQVSHPSNRSTP